MTNFEQDLDIIVASLDYLLFFKPEFKVFLSIINPFNGADEVRETANVPQISLNILKGWLREAGIYVGKEKLLDR